MKKILIATHSHFASGIKDTIELLTGSVKSIKTIDAYIDDTNVMEEIISFVQSVSAEDQGVILTDIRFGSVNQTVINILSPFPENMFVVTGFNLPLLLEVCLYEEEITSNKIREMIEVSRREISFINDEMEKKENTDSEVDFFD